MKNTHDAIAQLSLVQNKFSKLSKLFGEFKKGLEHIQAAQFPLKGVEISG